MYLQEVSKIYLGKIPKTAKANFRTSLKTNKLIHLNA